MGIKDVLGKRRGTLYMFFSGKGGVGKTSIAAATALSLAEGGKKVLIISIDPAHSLSDSFGVRIGGEANKLRNNLFAVEIDPVAAVAEYKEKLSPQLDKLEALKGLGMEGIFDIAGMTPGIDEIAAFNKFLQYMHRDDYDVIVFDTAPTGHTLRFLSLPEVLDSWLGKMIKIRMQFSGVVNLFKKVLPFGNPEEDAGSGLEQLEGMKESIKEAKVVLSDTKRTKYNIVMIPEAMSILESERSMVTLNGYGIPVSGIVINQLIPENPGCGFCTEKRKLQLQRVREIREKFSSCDIKEASLFEHEVTGFESLEKLGKQLKVS